MRIIELNKSVTASNDLDAENLRAELKERGICLINLMSSPGSGKTTLISRLIRDMNEEVPIAVCEADIDSAVDAERIEALGAVAVQVHTDGMCHMDAGMTRRGLEGMNLDGIRLAFLENVGNLVCDGACFNLCADGFEASVEGFQVNRFTSWSTAIASAGGCIADIGCGVRFVAGNVAHRATHGIPIEPGLAFLGTVAFNGMGDSAGFLAGIHYAAYECVFFGHERRLCHYRGVQEGQRRGNPCRVQEACA